MPIPASEPRILIKDLVKDNWVAANVLGTTTPDWHTGWHNPSSLLSQGTFTNPSESAQGAHGYGAIEGGGGGAVQIWTGVLFLDFWARRVDGGVNPKQLNYECGQEAVRIILANAASVANLAVIGVVMNTELPPETDKDPPVFRRSLTIGYQWRTT
jgi:hypothetical protein